MTGLECWCCADNDQPGIAPSYVWTDRNGLETLLCVSCCAIWRQGAAESPGLVPSRIRSLGLRDGAA